MELQDEVIITGSSSGVGNVVCTGMNKAFEN